MAKKIEVEILERKSSTFTLPVASLANTLHQGECLALQYRLQTSEIIWFGSLLCQRPKSDNNGKILYSHIVRTKCTTEQTTTELKYLLNDEHYTKQAAEVRRQIQAENGVFAACDAIVAYLKKPV